MINTRSHLSILKFLFLPNTKIRKAIQDVKMGWFGVVNLGDTRSLDLVPFDRTHTISY